MADQGTAVATRTNHPLVQFKEYVEQRATELQAALPAHISAEKFQRTLMTAVQENPDLLQCDRRSLWLACLKCGHDGLLPDKREAVILPFKENKKVDGVWQTKYVATYIPMVFGIRKKILQSGEVTALEVGVVYRKEVEANHFYYEVGKYPPLGHRPMLDVSVEEAADENIIGAYSIATMKDGTKSYEFMRRFEIDKVRETSQTGATRNKKGEPRQSFGPWVEWFPEQCKKTVMKRHSKTLPMSTDIIIESDQQLAAAASVTALLSSVNEDEPVMLTDDADGSQYDSETGEVVDTASAEGNAPADDGATTQGAAQSDASDTSEAESQTDDALFETETAEVRQKQEQAAEEILEAFSKARDLTSLKTAYDDNQLELAGLPDDLAEAVEGGYERNLKRLGSTRTKIAREVAQAAAAREAEPVK